MVPCPPAESLERLLSEQLSEPERNLVEGNFEDCTVCQEALRCLAENVPRARLESALIRLAGQDR